MLRFSRIDENFTVYRGKKIVIFGAGNTGRVVYNNLSNLNTNVICFCDNDPKKQNTTIFGKKVILLDELKDIYNDDIIVQIASIYDVEIENQLVDNGYSNYITYGEYKERKIGANLYFIGKNDLNFVINYHKDKVVRIKNDSIMDLTEYISEVAFFNKKTYCFHCMPPKTGDGTLEFSTSKYTSNFRNLWHTLSFFDKIRDKIDQSKTIKFVAATRDVIAQNISCFFQETNGYWPIQEFWHDGGDVQFLFDLWLKKFVRSNIPVFSNITYEDITNKMRLAELRIGETKKTFFVQCFFREQYEKYLGIDVYKYPFDQEKGYSIIKEGNTEIFIYQLERLNDIAAHLGEFMGLEEFELQNSNESREKWYGKVYKQALKELKISREYFDECYNSEYMKHFYSDTDIEKFKKKWEKNIYN